MKFIRGLVVLTDTRKRMMLLTFLTFVSMC